MLSVNSIFQNSESFIYFFASISFALAIILVGIIFQRKYILKILYLGAVSICSALLYLLLDAPDVALTEASIGACLTTVVYVLFLTKIKQEKESYHNIVRSFVGVIVVFFVFSIFYHIEAFIPEFGDMDNKIHQGSMKHYIENTEKEIGITSFIAAILASYRGFDTFGETLVILVAGCSIHLIMGIKDEKK